MVTPIDDDNEIDEEGLVEPALTKEYVDQQRRKRFKWCGAAGFTQAGQM
mgnify:CR=1 FL=1